MTAGRLRRLVAIAAACIVIPAGCDEGTAPAGRDAGAAEAGAARDGSVAREGGAVRDGGARDGGAGDGAFADGRSDATRSDGAGGRTDGGSAFSYYAVNHVLSTGQSLSVGAAGAPALSRTQPYRNMMFNRGVRAPGGTGLTSFVPLVEEVVETMASGMANLVTKLAREVVFKGWPPPRNSHRLLVSGHGVGGWRYAQLKKGTVPFANGMAQVRAGLSIAKFLGLSYVVRAVTNVHGESDHLARNGSYDKDLLTWQADYEAGVKAITGQTEPVPMFHTQMSSWTKYGQVTSNIPLLQLAASVAAPDRLPLVGPKYQLAYARDGVHLTNHGYRHMGEYYAKVYRRVVLERKRWEPLRPLKATRAGTTITVSFHVPVPPLVLDTKLVTNPGNYGFAFWDRSGGPPAITAVKLAGPTSVTITLSRAPTGPEPTLGYAIIGKPRAPAGPRTGPRGNLRDSDRTPSRHGYPLYNWCVHFAIPVK